MERQVLHLVTDGPGKTQIGPKPRKKRRVTFRCRQFMQWVANIRSKMKYSQAILTTLLCLAGMAYAQSPDNTKANQADRSPDAVTADQQKNNTSDRDLTRNIRRSIMADKSLSSYAHNVKIISQNGAVTLKGPVKSEEEKRAVVAKAVEVTGSADRVTDEISVKH